MNLKTNSIIVLILLNSIILSFARNMDLSKYGISERQRPKRLIDRFAINLIEYFNIDKLLIANRLANMKNQTIAAQPMSPRTSTVGCNSTDEITEYFFNVYGENKKSFIPQKNLDELIKHQIRGFPKSRTLQYRTDQNICPRKTCFKYDTISPMVDERLIDRETFLQICPVLLFNGELNGCEFVEDSTNLQVWEKWVYGMLLSGVVSIWSWGGAIIFPIIQKKIYKRMLTFMISLAFGCLTCNSLLKYIPLADGFDITNIENTNRSYFLKHLVILAVLFFFFNFERFMKIYAIYKTQKFKEKQRLLEAQSDGNLVSQQSYYTQSSQGDDEAPQFSLEPNDEDETADQQPKKMTRSASRINKGDKMKKENKEHQKHKMKKRMSMDLGHVNLIGIQEIGQVTDEFARVMKQKQKEMEDDEEDGELVISKSGRICCTSLTEGLNNVRPIGWMAIFGDGLGNFIDGLSIGASISQNIILGLTTAFATWCGNIPQELGDFALLVRSGMTPFQALFYNYLSANSVYLGCAIGIIFGSDLESARWIFAISGATSLYLGLAVLLPEMKSEFDENKDPIPEKLKITYIQLLGMLSGITFIVILNMYEDDFEASG